MSAIEELIKYTNMSGLMSDKEKANEARAEYDRLRFAASETNALRAERDELKARANVSICAWCGQECEKESGSIASHVIVCEKRPEHAMLAKFEELLATVAAQARQIEAARELLDLFRKNSREVSEGDCIYCNCEQGGGNDDDCYYDCPMNEVRAWLSANASAQEAEEVTK